MTDGWRVRRTVSITQETLEFLAVVENLAIAASAAHLLPEYSPGVKEMALRHLRDVIARWNTNDHTEVVVDE